MLLFLDTANKSCLEQRIATGLIDGITTNPSLLAQEADPLKAIKEICQLLPHGDISVEVTEAEPRALYEQAKRIAALAENIIVKIPCYAPYVPVIEKLVQEEVALNITLVFTPLQGMIMAKLGVMYVSPFVGRLQDANLDGIAVIENMRTLFDLHDIETLILAASMRSQNLVEQALLAGADAVTVPPAIFDQLLDHPLTKKGMETFQNDWQKGGTKIFP